MTFAIPQSLRDVVASLAGEEGRAWLDALPDLVASLMADWQLRLIRVIDGGATNSWIGVVERPDGTTAVLKAGLPHDEARHEVDGLIAFDGTGAVRVYEHDRERFALLLELCDPGHDLWTLREDEGNLVACEVLERLWRPVAAVHPFETLDARAARWAASFGRTFLTEGYDPGLLDRAAALALVLARSQPEHVLLHGDFHPFNVLASQREAWLAIDPKPVVGERAYDLAQFLENRADDARKTGDATGHLRRQLEAMSDRLGLDAERVARWTFVKAHGWTWGPEEVRQWAQVARL